MVPGSFGCGSAVLAAIATLAPSRGGPQRDGQADAARAAGNEQRLALQRRHFFLPPSSRKSGNRLSAKTMRQRGPAAKDERRDTGDQGGGTLRAAAPPCQSAYLRSPSSAMVSAPHPEVEGAAAQGKRVGPDDRARHRPDVRRQGESHQRGGQPGLRRRLRARGGTRRGRPRQPSPRRAGRGEDRRSDGRGTA